MSRLSPQHAQARRALIEDIQKDQKGWLQHGIAALAVSVLGLGVAGSIMLTGSAQQSSGTVETTTVQTIVAPGVVQPSEFDSREDQVTRSTSREALSAAQVAELAKKRADTLTKADAASDKVAQKKATSAREKELDAEATARQKNASRIKAEKEAAAAAAAAAAKESSSASQSATTRQNSTTQQNNAPVTSPPATTTSTAGDGRASLPITSGYTIAAHFGQVGSWSRYHTGLDFAAPVGTPIHAPTSGTVTNAGPGSASGWAGNYVTIKHADGTSTLYAHMSTVSVSVGQAVTGGQVLGAVGMTGRTFGPHCHFEVYPAGVTPGDVYSAINPEPWLVALGVHP